jgi:CheY-like chemotaxis protein
MSLPRRILVADDNRDFADTLCSMLMLLGYETVVAYDGRQAVDLARDFGAELVIMDINMPVLNGYAAARLLRVNRDAETPIVLIALTGRGSKEDKAHALEAGFDFHFQKPIGVDELTEVIERALPQ